MNDTIAAISTPFGEGAIAVIRMSGPRAIAVADDVFRAKTNASDLSARVQQFGSIFEGERKLDNVLLSVHRAPASYTGEDVVEINCHGGVLVTRRILELPDVKDRMSGQGAEPAGNTPEEFAAFIRSEQAKWRKVIQQGNIKL
jgi:tRNA U34 5-carboxymethylaminomethyl modifying GTPase MnmE/TrmE